jgi:MFS family permease
VARAGDRRFVRAVVPVAPWVFGAATVSIAVLPGLVTATTGGWAVAFNALVAGVTLGTGYLVQPAARRLAVRDLRRGVTVGLLAIAAGLGLAAGAAATASPVLVALAAVALGGGYGCSLVCGLLQVQAIAPATELAGLTAVYYALTYVGFVLPVLLAALAHTTSYPVLLGALAVLVLVTLLAARVGLRTRVPLPKP